MLQIININRKHAKWRAISLRRLGLLSMLGLFASIGASVIHPAPTYAACTDDNVSCVEVKFGAPQGETSVQPGLSYYDSAKFYLPVQIGMKNTSFYTIKVYGNGNNLQSGSNTIPSIGTDTSYEQLGKSGSEWGIRWNLGNTVEDKETNYHKVPASASDASSVVVKNAALPKSTTMTTKQLTLGFAVAVDGNQPSGSYTNTVTVAVVASPGEMRSFFDISTMQEMTPEICANTTTPTKTATTKFDTTGAYPKDASYVPQTTLTDARDNKSYLVRKLADGNCWMSQNLSLNLSTSKALTSSDTDLNSKASWTPTHTTQTGVGTVWGANNGQDHSSSSGWNQYWAGGATFNTAGATAYGGTVGYAQRGNYYNWFAATAGSGKSTDLDSTTEAGTIAGTNRIKAGAVQDSICPKGWRLPVGGGTAVGKTDGSVKSFYNLVQLYTGKTGAISGATVDTLYGSPMHFVPIGLYDNTTAKLSNVGVWQLYWVDAATGTASFAASLYFGDSTVHPGTAGGTKGNGMAIRCVAR